MLTLSSGGAQACRYEDRFHDGEQCTRQSTATSCAHPCSGGGDGGGGGDRHCDVSCEWCGDACVANSSRDDCCSAQTQRDGSAPAGCVSCGEAGGSACCQEGFGAQVNCSAWDRTPGDTPTPRRDHSAAPPFHFLDSCLAAGRCMCVGGGAADLQRLHVGQVSPGMWTTLCWRRPGRRTTRR